MYVEEGILDKGGTDDRKCRYISTIQFIECEKDGATIEVRDLQRGFRGTFWVRPLTTTKMPSTKGI